MCLAAVRQAYLAGYIWPVGPGSPNVEQSLDTVPLDIGPQSKGLLTAELLDIVPLDIGPLGKERLAAVLLDIVPLDIGSVGKERLAGHIDSLGSFDSSRSHIPPLQG